MSAGKWNLGGNVAKAALQFLFGIVLARLLGPEAFGTIAIALLMIGLGALVADLGFSAALIQQRRIDRRDIDFVFTMQVAFGLGLALLGFLAAPTLARFFGEPTAVAVIQVMALVFVIRAVGQAARALLSRELKFRAIQTIAITAYLVSFGALGIPLALSGQGVWSLVWAQLTQAILETLFLLFAARRTPRLTLRAGNAPVFRVGRQVVAANIGSWLIMNLDAVLVGRNLGTISLGLYSRALTFVAAPGGALATGLQSVLFSASARAESDPARISRAYFETTRVVALLCFPLYLAIAAVPEPIIFALYGDAWAGAIPLIPPLALAMAIYSILSLIGPVLMALDETHREVTAQFTAVLVMGPILYLASTISLETVGWAVLLLNLTRFCLLYRGLTRALTVNLRQLATVVAYPFAVGVAAFAAVSLTDAFLRSQPASTRLAAAIVVAAITQLVVIHLLRRRLFHKNLSEALGSGKVSAAFLRWLGE